MTAKLIDGKALAATYRAQIANEIRERSEQGYRSPGLAVILVGEDHASHIYVQNKRKACEEVGIRSFYYPLPAHSEEQDLIHLINKLNNDESVDGILLQLPLPKHINSKKLLECIHPKKDIDGFHPFNVGRLATGIPLFRPCTPYGVMALLDSTHEVYKNRHAVVVGASNVVGRPMALELLLSGSTVTICHRFTLDLKPYVADADILISAVGKPELIKGAWIKPGATVIDVGINRLPDGTIIGDVEFKEASKHAAFITPVPGGVGPMTTTMLLKNTLLAAKSNSQQQYS